MLQFKHEKVVKYAYISMFSRKESLFRKGGLIRFTQPSSLNEASEMKLYFEEIDSQGTLKERMFAPRKGIMNEGVESAVDQFVKLIPITNRQYAINLVNELIAIKDPFIAPEFVAQVFLHILASKRLQYLWIIEFTSFLIVA